MSSENESQYPEHDKLHDVREQSQAVGEFLEWLTDASRFQLAEYASGPDPEARYEIVDKGRDLRFRFRLHVHHPWGHDLIGRYETKDEAVEEMARRQQADQDRAGRQTLVRAYPNTNDLLAEYFGLDRQALEREKRAILASLRVGA